MSTAMISFTGESSTVNGRKYSLCVREHSVIVSKDRKTRGRIKRYRSRIRVKRQITVLIWTMFRFKLYGNDDTARFLDVCSAKKIISLFKV